MYLRKVSRKNTDGSSITYLQIAENIWDSQKKRSRVRVPLIASGNWSEASGASLPNIRQKLRDGSFKTAGSMVVFMSSGGFGRAWE